jgi:hypothetical protein
MVPFMPAAQWPGDVAAVEDDPGLVEGPGEPPGLAGGDGEGAAGARRGVAGMGVAVGAGGGTALHLALVVELGRAVAEEELVNGRARRRATAEPSQPGLTAG